MKNKNELTENLKALETKVYNAKVELKALNSKLEASYQYEDELMERQVFAKNQTKEIRKEFFKKSNEITQTYNEIQNVVDVFTGNFHGNIEIK